MKKSALRGHTGAMEYREWQPAGLEEVLSCMWIRVVSATDDAPTMVLPDGCSDLMWSSEHGALIAGPDTRPAPAELAPGTVLIGARFRPGAGGPALGLPLAELRDQRVEVADVSPALARRLPPTLSPAEAELRMRSVVAELAAAGDRDAEVGEGARLLAARPELTIAGLARALYLSERQLRRRFDAAVGYGPKMLQRVLRFRGLLARLGDAERPCDLARVASELGYADQAHLTRETRELSGQTPTELGRATRSG